MSPSPASSVVHVPVPRESVAETAAVWLPFVQRIAARTRCGVAQHCAEIESGQVQLHLAWAPDELRALALAATNMEVRGSDKIAVLVWCTGSMRELWLPLLDDIERYVRQHLGCAGIKAYARPGWSKILKQRGYRLTHVVMEKD